MRATGQHKGLRRFTTDAGEKKERECDAWESKKNDFFKAREWSVVVRTTNR